MRNKNPVRLSGLLRARATWRKARPQIGDRPGVFVLEFGSATGPAVLNDGRELRAVLTPAELASVLDAIPLLTLARDGDDTRAFKRVTALLRREA
jgi:hypothetical protein